MAKVVQFLEIGNLTKSQLNPCRLKKVMTKTSLLSAGSYKNHRISGQIVKNIVYFAFRTLYGSDFSRFRRDPL